MISEGFQDRLARSLSGELSEKESEPLFLEIFTNPEALEEFLAARTLDHDLQRLLRPNSGDPAFLRGVINAGSSDRKDPEAFVQSVARALSKKSPRGTTRKAHRAGVRTIGVFRLILMAAGLLVGAISLWFLIPHGLQPSEAPGKGRAPRPPLAQERPPGAPEAPLPERKAVEDRPIERPPAQRPPAPETPAAPKGAPREGENKPLATPDRPTPPPEPPAPAPAPVHPGSVPPRPTLTAFATLGKMKGEVYVFAGAPSRNTPASEGQLLSPGQGVLCEGPQSGAVVARHDALQLTLGANTEVRFAELRPEIALVQGTLDVEAGPREPGQEVLITTPHAELRVRESRFNLTATPNQTSVEVKQGAARFTSAWDGKSLEIKAGQHALAQDPPGIDRRSVDEAIRKGVAYLKNAVSQGAEVFRIDHCDELILLTLLSAGISEHDPTLQKYLKNILSAPLGKTYAVSLQAMALEELDRVKYQDRIAECGQFLLDNQCANGQWTYDGSPSKVAFVSETRPEVATHVGAAPTQEAGADLFGRRSKPKVVRLLKLKKTRDGAAQGDNSNAQYAALGLRASADAGISFPAETLQRAADGWRRVQYADPAGRGQATGEGGPARGWCYNDGKTPVNGGPCCVGAYASMTAGAVSSLMIYDHLLGSDWKKDLSVRLGMNWLAIHFNAARNLGIDQAFRSVNGGTTPPDTYHYYSLYAVERVGMFSAQEKMGRHSWFAEGAKVILARQKADGSWSDGTLSSHPTWDTCFAILFLRRATRPLEDVPSVDRLMPKGPAEK